MIMRTTNVIEPRSPEMLDAEDLEDLVRFVQYILWLDPQEGWIPRRTLDDHEALRQVEAILESYGLKPKEIE